LIIHTHGWKAQRDREKLVLAYIALVNHFWVKPLQDWELAQLNNFQIDRLCRDIYAKQPKKEIRWFSEKMGRRPRTEEFKFRWFIHDLLHPKKRPTMQSVKAKAPLVAAQ
jgi:hypothetical protein